MLRIALTGRRRTRAVCLAAVLPDSRLILLVTTWSFVIAAPHLPACHSFPAGALHTIPAYSYRLPLPLIYFSVLTFTSSTGL